MPENDSLDLLIDSALSTYAGPDSGFERRILARIAALPAVSSRPRRLLWSVAIPVAVCLSILIALVVFKPVHQSATHAMQHPRARQPLVAVAHPTPALRAKPSENRALRLHSVAKEVSLPELEVFPTPEPLTSQEQALAVYAARTPAPALRALATAQQHDDAAELAEIAAMQVHAPQPPEGNAN